ncbi:gliding motility-associated C-terminal domain-containing protein, partial [Flavobacteriaceae bacterium]|nr:gliding motility-associated C-terminal domain-containing protein [Flavobacteriaceae bacterium]MDB9731104.1 gliding motility-associated C-terminal domain-containing protein [Flavobacteriaceae bacterium]
DDNDGILDTSDNCPLTFNADQKDTDSDGIGDVCDNDDDGDGVLDTNDAFPLDPTEWTDTDADGIGNNADNDDDNDGFTDLDELVCDSDPLDRFNKPADQDNDLIPDCVDPDRDGDGYDNTQDVFPDNDREWEDFDKDGLGNNFDVDDDNDGCLDATDLFPLNPNECSDADNDGIGDNADPDDNNDGFDDDKLFVSGLLTPGSSGLEDTWKVINIEQYPNARVIIYNRNAQEVFSVLGYKNNWRGTYKGSSNLLPAGSYYYVVDLNNGEKPITGWLYLTY